MVRTLGTEPDPVRRLRQKQGRRLREFRGYRGLTLRALADLVSATGVPITAQAISKWESGVATPRPHHQVAICKALDVMPSAIFGLDQEVA